MYMFRRKRTCLAKRLWKARIRGSGGSVGGGGGKKLLHRHGKMEGSDDEECSTCCRLTDEGLLRNSLLKRLKDHQLEILVEAVESGGALGVSTCILVPEDAGVEAVQNGMMLCCQLWRFPDLQSLTQLRRTPACSSAVDPLYNCCNPYHWSRLCDYESPPPPYLRENDTKFESGDGAPSQPWKYSTSDHPPPYSFSTHGDDADIKENEWCKIAYWELSERVGRMYSVQNSSLDVFWTVVQADGLSLEALAENRRPQTESVGRNRSKIGLGITLSLELDGVWLYNRSEWPVFVNSPSLERDFCMGRKYAVYRVPSGHCFRVFVRKEGGCDESEKSEKLEGKRDCNHPPIGPVDMNSIRISFAKGWGPKYSRQEIIACPTWLEVLLSPCR